MSVFRALFVLVILALPSPAATFGTVVAHPQPLADLVLDEARRRIYVVNTAANQVEVYATNVNPPRQTNVIRTEATPLALAMSRNGRSLYVTCYDASSINIIDLTSTTFAAHSVTLPAKPEGVAVGFNEKLLITTIGTATGQSGLLTFDPAASSSAALQTVIIGPAVPTAPQLPPPSNKMALANHSRLLASADGRTIVGINESNTSRSAFVFDVNSSTVLAARVLGGQTPILAISPDGGNFVSGSMLLETSSMFVLAQQNIANAPFVFPNGANFTTQTNQGGAVYAQTSSGLALITAYNIVPVQSPAAKSNTSQLLINDPSNMLIELSIMLPENLSGKMVITADSSTIYAISESGFMVLPIGALSQSPIGVPDSSVALLASDQCGVTAALNSAVIPVRDIGGGRITPTVALVSTTTTSTAPRTTSRPYGADVTVSFSAGAARTLGTATPDQVIIQATEAVNVINNVRIFQNNRNAETDGNIIPVDIGGTTAGLTDMVTDIARQRLYIANPGRNRLEVFDMQKRQFQNPIPVGQLPRSMAFANDGNTLYVANAGSETISVVDLGKGSVTGRVTFPPLPFNTGLGVITPQLLASSQRGPHVLMSDNTLWKIVGNTLVPRTLNPNVFGTARSIPAPQTMVSSPEGSFVLLLAGNGIGYLYDASIDDFVSGRQIIPTPIAGYFGPISAGPNGQYYLVNDQILNSALTTIGSGAGQTGPVSGGGLPVPSGPGGASRPVSAVSAFGAQSFARFSTPVRASTATTPTDAGLLELVDVNTLRTTAASAALEGPLAVVTGTARANINGRTMAVDSAGTTAFVLTASGLSIIPLTPVSANSTPQLANTPLVNTANLTTGVAPGGLVTVVGRNLATTTSSSGTPLPTVLGGVCVTLNNSPIPLLATSGTQISAQLPFTIAANRFPLVVHSIAAHAASNSATVTISKYAPAVFFDDQGPAIYHKDGVTRVNKQHPASRDEPLTIYATGLGTTTGGKVTAGSPSPSSPLAVTAKVSLFFGDPTISQAAVIVDWSGLDPGKMGVYKINCRIPGTHLKGDALPVTVRIGGVNSVTTGPTAAVVYVN